MWQTTLREEGKMNDIVIQEYAFNHQEELIQMILTIQQQEFTIAITREDQPDLANIPQYYQQGNGNFWVALQGTTVVGSVGLIDIGNQQVALRKMFVDADFRGPQFAVAQSLLATVLNWVREKGVHSIFLGTTDKFLAAHRFYEKKGFERIAQAELPPTFPVMRVDTVFYRLQA
jgi:N-acetylglutamate synthase-like GNAT family acetyltransferase